MKVVCYTMGRVFHQIPYPCDSGVRFPFPSRVTPSKWSNENSTFSFVESEKSRLNDHRYLLRAAVILQCDRWQCHSSLMCNPYEIQTLKKKVLESKAWPQVVAANLDIHSVIPSPSLLHSLLFSLRNLVFMVYKLLWSGVYKFLFHIFT